MTKHTQQLALMLIIGTLIGFAIVKVFSASSQTPVSSENSTPENTAPSVAEDVLINKDTISSAKHFPLPPTVPLNTRVGLSVLDQPASKQVVVTSVSVDVISWVAVYDQVNGAPGSILGASKVKPGETSATVDLLRPEGTLSGLTYYVAILPDNGDGEFNRLTDLPPFSPDRLSIVTFKTQ